MVRSSRVHGSGGLGSVQLRDAGQLAGEALMVPWTHFQKRRRVPAEFGHQRQLPGAGKRELAWSTFDIVAVRRPRLPLPYQRGQRWQGNDSLERILEMLKDVICILV